MDNVNKIDLKIFGCVKGIKEMELEKIYYGVETKWIKHITERSFWNKICCRLSLSYFLYTTYIVLVEILELSQ